VSAHPAAAETEADARSQRRARRRRSAPVRFLDADEAVALIGDGDSLSIEGSGGGLLEPDRLIEALGNRFRRTGHPRDLALAHCTGIGDRDGGGLDHLAQDGLARRVIGGHWGMAPAMARMAVEGRFEAYNFPQGVMAQLHREIAAGRPGLLTHVGLGTFCDPRLEGGRLNARTREDLVEVVTLAGREWLLYRPFDLDACFIRATTADEDGNLSFEQEAARLGVLAVAQATHNAGGTVIAQVKRKAAAGSLDPRSVVVPGMLVDVVVVHPGQWQTVADEYNPAFSGEVKVAASTLAPMALTERKVVARRALQEVRRGDVVNLGVGMADGIASVAAEEGCLGDFTLTIEQGLVGGVPAQGVIFGVSHNPVAIVDQPAQFDFYDGGGLDSTFLGFAQADREGNVNVSRFGSKVVGTGGFVNISQNASLVVFCGTFTAGGLDAAPVDGRLKLRAEGRHRKFVERVEQVTFNGRLARERGMRVLFVTERAVLELGRDGLVLREVAPGLDPEADVAAHMDFPIRHDGVRTMEPALFEEALLGWQVPE
jgi:propionate CoA-transferase